MESILTSIKKALGLGEAYTCFDDDVIMYINYVFMFLNQIGIGPPEGFSIKDKSTKWNEYITGSKLEAVKSYIYLRVRLIFDPPTNSFLVEAIKDQIKEIEWRLNIKEDGVS